MILASGKCTLGLLKKGEFCPLPTPIDFKKVGERGVLETLQFAQKVLRKRIEDPK